MVQLEEVPDDELNAQQPGPSGKEDEDEWDTDSGIFNFGSHKKQACSLISRLGNLGSRR